LLAAALLATAQQTAAEETAALLATAEETAALLATAEETAALLATAEETPALLTAAEETPAGLPAAGFAARSAVLTRELGTAARSTGPERQAGAAVGDLRFFLGCRHLCEVALPATCGGKSREGKEGNALWRNPENTLDHGENGS
jgi:hypothetical protein